MCVWGGGVIRDKNVGGGWVWRKKYDGEGAGVVTCYQCLVLVHQKQSGPCRSETLSTFAKVRMPIGRIGIFSLDFLSTQIMEGTLIS